MFSAANCFITWEGIPSGFSGGGKGFGAVRLLYESIVFCFPEGFPAQAIPSPLSSKTSSRLDMCHALPIVVGPKRPFRGRAGKPVRDV